MPAPPCRHQSPLHPPAPALPPWPAAALLACWLLPLAGCTPPPAPSTALANLARTNPAAVQTLMTYIAVRSQCEAPPGTGPFEPTQTPTKPVKLPVPPRVLAESLSTCAGVRFRIGGDGAPIDISVLREFPQGYGVGAVAHELIAQSRWAPRDDLAWHYAIFVHLSRAAVPGAAAPAAPPAFTLPPATEKTPA